jgi:AraC-like DNA-binding protein
MSGRQVYVSGFTTVDLTSTGIARAVVSAKVVPHLLRLRGSREPHGRLRYAGSARLTLARLSYGAAVELVAPAMLEAYLVVLPVRGGVVGRGGGKEEALTDRCGVAFGSTEAFSLSFAADATVTLLRVSRHFLAEQLDRALRGPVVAPIRPARGFDLTTPHARTLLDGVAFAERVFDSSDGPASVPRIMIESFLAAQMLYAVPHEHSSALDAAQRPRRSRGVEAVVGYIDEHAAQPLTVSDLVTVAGSSLRSLQEAFRAELGLSPMAYLRHVRLRRAYEELVAQAPDASVTATAMRWGFFHVGRFAEEYRRQFGVLPSVTARGAGNRGVGGGLQVQVPG